jgi:hypothetical protein
VRFVVALVVEWRCRVAVITARLVGGKLLCEVKDVYYLQNLQVDNF